MKRGLGCILAVAGWYLLYPPATHRGNPDSYTTLSQWNIDGSYGTVADCNAAYRDDLDWMAGLSRNSHDLLQTQAGRCVASDDPPRKVIRADAMSFRGQQSPEARIAAT
jgi:hypothetical protein